jgi:hypothetical protein
VGDGKRDQNEEAFARRGFQKSQNENPEKAIIKMRWKASEKEKDSNEQRCRMEKRGHR